MCKEVVHYISKIDPGQTKRMGVFLLELNKPKMMLAKMDMDEGKIDRVAFFKLVKEGARVEKLAKDMLGRFETPSMKELKDILEKARLQKIAEKV